MHDRFDVIFCRNVMIYFSRETQQRLIKRYAGQLSPSGYLFLGHSENIHSLTGLFQALGGTIHRLGTEPGGRGSKLSFFAKSSQKGQPVSGLKCHCTISRTCASRCSRTCWMRSSNVIVKKH